MKRINDLAPEQKDDLLAQAERHHTGYAATFAADNKGIDLTPADSLNEGQREAFRQRAAQYALEQTVTIG